MLTLHNILMLLRWNLVESDHFWESAWTLLHNALPFKKKKKCYDRQKVCFGMFSQMVLPLVDICFVFKIIIQPICQIKVYLLSTFDTGATLGA